MVYLRIFAVALALTHAAAHSAPETTRTPPHGCISCHTAAIKIDEMNDPERMHCGQCHAPPGSASTDTAPLMLADAQTVGDANKLAPDAGMRYPMFNATSRLGDVPNEMIHIPAGRFIRGTNDRLFDEGPQHEVDIPAFDIDRFEVTNAQYKRFIEETQRRSPDHFRNRSYPDGKADHPVTFVTWNDADAYCQWAGKRLPTDVEWEKAARGTKGQTYPWGNDMNLLAANTPMRWAAAGQNGDTTPVGSFAAGASPYGAYDMSGNVWEWTSSWYEGYPGSSVQSENYGQRYKTLKGGSWFDCSFYKCGISAPTFNRAFFAPKTKNDTFGFRCARDAAKTSTAR